MTDNGDSMHKETINYAKYSSIALQMLGIIGLGTYAGVKLDQ